MYSNKKKYKTTVRIMGGFDLSSDESRDRNGDIKPFDFSNTHPIQAIIPFFDKDGKLYYAINIDTSENV